MDGFHSQDATGVFVQLGEDASLTFQLQLATIDETVIVVGESTPLINPSRTGSTSNVAQQALESLPTINRGLEDFARTNPFFTSSAENEDEEAISVAGRSSRYNNISIDGAVNNDLFGLSDSGTPGGQTRSTPISLDAIQELQLLLSSPISTLSKRALPAAFGARCRIQARIRWPPLTLIRSASTSVTSGRRRTT